MNCQNLNFAWKHAPQPQLDMSIGSDSFAGERLAGVWGASFH